MISALNGLEANHGMNIILAVVVIIACLIFWNIQRDKDNKVDLMDLICVDGQLNEHKFMRFVAFVVSTWGFIYLIVDQRFSEWYFAGYMAAWTGNALLNKWLNIKEQSAPSAIPPPPPPPIKTT